LKILCLTPWPPSPPRMGVQARMHGLTAGLARSHEITVVSLLEPAFDEKETARALDAYCRDFALVPNRRGLSGLDRRLLQARSLLSRRSFHRHQFAVPALQEELDRRMRGEAFDVVKMDLPYLSHFRVRQAPPGCRPPAVVIDTHDIAYDLLRQVARSRVSLLRRLYAGISWRKLAREEREAWRSADGLCVCSEADAKRVRADVPEARLAVVPNAADVEYFRPRPTDPPSDGRTVLFFGLLSTFPNSDGVGFLLNEIWPRIAAARPQARLKVVGAQPPEWLRAQAGPRLEVTGVVDDLRPHLAGAAVVVVPLRFGSGTRLKIVEAMAMSRPVVSTALGAEGIVAEAGRDILIADDPAGFAAAVQEVLDRPERAEALGRAGRALVEGRYSWTAAADAMGAFFGELRGAPAAAEPR
jgi:glycosyltransferase involved in cell wall biosynthesis